MSSASAPKRGRASSSVHPAALIRRTLLSRVDELEKSRATHTAGNTDASLCALGCFIVAALEDLDAEEAGAHDLVRGLGASLREYIGQILEIGSDASLEEPRALLHAAADARCEQLTHAIESARAVKKCALEYELVAVDNTLEKYRLKAGDVREAASSLDDDTLYAQRNDLAMRLDRVGVMLQTLPTAVVEPPFVRVVNLELDRMCTYVFTRGSYSPRTLIESVGRVVAPLAITAADLSVEYGLTVRQGRIFLRLRLGARHTHQSAEEIDLSLNEDATSVHASLTEPGSEPQPLKNGRIFRDKSSAQRSILIHLDVPSAGCQCTMRTKAEINAISVAGQAVSFSPMVLYLRGIMPRPATWEKAVFPHETTPCVTPEGLLFCVASGGLHVYDAGGAPKRLDVEFPPGVQWAAYADGDPSMVVLAQSCPFSVFGFKPQSVAALQWTYKHVYASVVCAGIVALPNQGKIVVGMECGSGLLVLRLSDGALLGEFDTRDCTLLKFMAADAASGAVFGNLRARDLESSASEVWKWSLAANTAGQEIYQLDCKVAAAHAEGATRDRLFDDGSPLTVMPAAPGMLDSYLLVWSRLGGRPEDVGELRVLSLPGLALVHTHRMERVRVYGLAADPWGRALVVRDVNEIIVLAWPLPGMPPLH